jgi:hypothetical protein
MAWPPALAFAVTILAFNLAGEGILRLIERLGASFTRLLNRYTALAAVAFIALVMLIRAQTGPVAFYKSLAEFFDGQRALEHVAVLASPEMAGRRVGTEEADAAAEYIAAQFKAAGLQPAGQLGTYFQDVNREFMALTAPPTLTLLGADGGEQHNWAWQEGFNVPLHYPYRVNGRRSGEVVFVGVGTLPEPNRQGGYRFLESVAISDLEGKVILAPDRLSYEAVRQSCPSWGCPIAGALIITDDNQEMNYYQLGTTYSPSAYVRNGNIHDIVITSMHPVMLVDRQVAETLVEGTGTTLDSLEQQTAQLDLEEVLLQPLEKQVALQIPAEPRQETVRHVLGYMPGGTGTGGGAGQSQTSSLKMDDQIIIVMAAYDGPGVAPDGGIYPSAQNNAAGVATLIELAHSWQEADYRPKRAVLFAAYVWQGVDKNHSFRRRPEPNEFLQAATGFTQYKIRSVFDVRGLGDAKGHRLIVDTESARLGKLLVQSARRAGAGVLRVESVLDLEVIQEGGEFSMWGEAKGEQFVWAEVSWEGGENLWGTTADRQETLSSESLEQAGEALSLALMVLGRERNY